MTRSMRKTLCVAAVATLPLCARASAQQAEFVQAQTANAAALHRYSWKSRTELRLDDESVHVTLDQVRYDFDGRVQKTRIGGSDAPQDNGGRGRGGVRRRVVSHKKAEFRDLLEELAALAASYTHLSHDQLQAFARRATVTPGLGAGPGTMRIQGRDVLTPRDEMTVWVDSTTNMIRRVEIATVREGEAVAIEADFRDLAGGPTYQAHAVLRYPARHVEVVVENFDYQPQPTR